MRKASWVLVVTFATMLLAAAAPAFAISDVFERSYPLRSGGSFTLSNVNGSVQVEAWDREEVQVRAVKESRNNPPDESLVKIDVEATPEAVTVATRYPREDGLDVTVEYRIRVPAHLLQARIETVNGNVRVRGIEAAGELRTVNGDIELLDGAGHISARSTNGNIRLELASLGEREGRPAPISVETVNGSVVLELPAAIDAGLEVRSLNGDFHSEVPVAVQSSIGAGDFRGRLGRGGSLVRIRTVNGGIRIVTAKATV